MSNQTQADVESAAHLAAMEWVTSGARTLDRLNAIADEKAKYRDVPALMVRSTALNLLKERAPEVLALTNDIAVKP